MPEEILKPIHYVNGDLEVSGSAKIKEVKNGTGSIVTYDETTKELKKRTGTQIIEDLNLAAAFEVVPETISKTSTNLTTENGHTHELAQDVKNDIAKGVTAHGYGNHAQAGYLKTETDPVYVASITKQMMTKGIILENADLNTYNETGIYTQGANSIVTTFLNCPTNKALQLEVTSSAGMVYQRITDHVNNKIYNRNYAGSQWFPWKTVALTSDIPLAQVLSLGPEPGQLNLSGGGGSVQMNNLKNSSIDLLLGNIYGKLGSFSDALPIGVLNGFHTVENAFIDGIVFGHNGGTKQKRAIYVRHGQAEVLRYATKNTETAEWIHRIIADREWVQANYLPASQTYTKNQVNDLLAPKLDIEDLDGFVNNVTYNAANHKITFFKQNSPNIEVDLPIESLIKNVVLSGNNLVFTFENNTTVSVPLNTLLVGVVKEVNGKVPNSQGVITLEISDIPSLSSALDGKSNIRLSNVVSDLSVAEKLAVRNKIGAGTVNSVSISLPDGFTTGVSTITDSGTFNITFVQGYSLPTIESQNEWDSVVDEAVRLSGDQEIGGEKIALDKWTFVKQVVIPEGVENNDAVNVRQLGTKANRSLDNIPSNLTTLETNVIKQKLKIDNLQNTGNTYPLIMSSEFTEILTLIPEVTVENAVAYVRNRNLIVSITLKNATIANTDVVSVNSIVKLFSLPPEIIDILQAEITAIVPQVKLTSTDVYSTATNKMFLDFEDKSIKQPFRLTLRSSSSTIFYAEFECLDMV
ncbi:hypothetical protein EG240_05885 [Paenimyroides tangerinum]|uniref:Uncharacterized protein n=1 Tax=Paenimyroides tangerinum TaxID=2488728 RepID=A0A3P3W8Q9_9FLAO|nr:pyocin knob domain-containing protein [Paenimyroides tangerinum]RRJ91535.1 hypothetical protein EG240_05885 [Paenimyroides tangerinum]